MKTTSTATTAYESPQIRVVEIDSQELICTSQETGLSSFGEWEE